MKVNSNISRDTSFKGLWNSKFAKKSLEFASNNGALFAATTTFALSTGVRTLSILSTPKTEKENKKIACAKSIASGFLEFALTLSISLPIAAAFKKIDKNRCGEDVDIGILILLMEIQNGAATLKHS